MSHDPERSDGVPASLIAQVTGHRGRVDRSVLATIAQSLEVIQNSKCLLEESRTNHPATR